MKAFDDAQASSIDPTLQLRNCEVAGAGLNTYPRRSPTGSSRWCSCDRSGSRPWGLGPRRYVLTWLRPLTRLSAHLPDLENAAGHTHALFGRTEAEGLPLSWESRALLAAGLGSRSSSTPGVSTSYGHASNHAEGETTAAGCGTRSVGRQPPDASEILEGGALRRRRSEPAGERVRQAGGSAGSPTEATYPSGRINAAAGAATTRAPVAPKDRRTWRRSARPGPPME